MTLRVYDLAKELKISSAALMKHLNDMGIEVKSHMKYLEDDISDKVRQKFKQEVEQMKKLESERRMIQEQLRNKEKTDRESRHSNVSNPFNDTPVKKESEKVVSPFDNSTKQNEKPTTNRKEYDSQSKPNNYQNRQNNYQNRPRKTYNEDNSGTGSESNYNGNNRQYDRQRNYQNSSNPSDRNYQNSPNTSDRNYQNRPERTNRQNYRDKPTSGSQENTQNRPYRDRQGQPGYQRNETGSYNDRNAKTRSYKSNDSRQKDSDNQSNRSYSSRTTPKVSFPKAGIVKPEIPEKPKEKVFGKKKAVAFDDLGDKSKHLQAKLKNTKKRKKGEVVSEIDEAIIEKNIKQTLSTSKKKKKYKKEEKKTQLIEEISEINISEFTSVSELAKIIDITPSEIITKFFQMGKMVTINQRLDKDSLELICSEYDLDICFKDEFGTDMLQDKIDVLDDIEEKSRPPVVTIMGHVDHGKTSILDKIRDTKVVAGESGGITQHVGAYQAIHNGQKITFIDTPGHEAFTAMRARGANITDIAVIVVAANDGVKPQTIEAIDHARAAGVTMVIAINKIDLPEANIDKTIASLLEQNVFLEGYGGQISWTKCSAITGEGIDELLEMILLSAEILELKARYNGPGKGIVIESEKNARMGAKATILLQEGSLKKGGNIVVGSCYGHVRKMENERGKELTKIYPADIAVIYGLNDVPKAGDIINVVENEKIARQIGGERLLIRQEREKFQNKTNLGNLFSKIKQNEMTELRLVVKADVDGSVEALCDSLQKLSNDEIKITIIRKSVGGIIEADVDLASASDAIIIGFNVRANNKAKKLAEDSGVEIKFYQIIYDAIEDITKALIGMLSPEYQEKVLGSALVKQVFKIKKIGTIAGCAVEKGIIRSKSKVRLYRDDKVIYTGEMDNLKHYNESVNEVKSGTECGISIQNYSDIKEGDIIECYIMEEVERKL
ncbi:MAG: translation initiation factor IF-2 [Candidatus Cloacimonetes bacterium]|nr:translation initiation factor IF-2 [Candidatus Cloacimonadota bacterium]